MRVSLNAVTLSLFVSFAFNNHDLAEAAKLRRGSVNSNEEIQDASDKRSLWSLGTLTDAEIFAMKKTPPGPLKSSKCGLNLGGDGTVTIQTASLLRKQHPGCIHLNEEGIQDLATLPPVGPPTNSPPPTLTPTSAPTVSSMPTSAPTQPLNCVQTVVGDELMIPVHQVYMKGEVHCLKLGDREAYFGYNWSNQFGLFVNGQAVWTVPGDIVEDSDRWIFQKDGNLMLRDSNYVGTWRTRTDGYWGSEMKVSFNRVWIEDDTGSTLWFQPPMPVPTSEPTMQPTIQGNLPTNAPTKIQEQRFKCVQTVKGTKLIVPFDKSYRRGDMHCLISDDNVFAYFGYTWLNEFGLFVNAESVWTIPSALGSFDHWAFQENGNLVLRNASGGVIWESDSHVSFGSQLIVSFDRVWIETDVGDNLWSQPPYIKPPLNCVQTVWGSELTIPLNKFFKKGEVHCLRSNSGDEAYFGYNLSGRFGLFVNHQPAWTAPEESVSVSDRWIFQTDGNMLLRDSKGQGIWRTETGGNYGSQMIVSFEQVRIESNTGLSLWIEPPLPEPLNPPLDTTDYYVPTASPIAFSSSPTSSANPTASPTEAADRTLNCVQTITGEEMSVPIDTPYRKGDVHCLKTGDGAEVYFGYTWTDKFGLFVNGETVWSAPDSLVASFDRWSFQGDGNLVVRKASDSSIWTTGTFGHYNSRLKVSSERVWIEDRGGLQLWSEPFYVTRPPTFPPTPPPTRPPTPGPTSPPTLPPPPSLPPTPPPTRSPTPPPTRPPTRPPTPSPTPPPTPPPTRPPTAPQTSNNSGLQYYAYYYPWYLRNDWSRHGYQDEPLLGKYGTNEVAVAEQHIQWARQAGISTWVISYWGPDHLTFKHFKAGMMNAPSINKMKFCMLYESMALNGRGSWRDGSKEEALYQDMKVIRDEFFNHPSYLRINGRPVIIFYVTRANMMYLEGFDGPSVLANLRRRLGHDVYFIADEPFFDWNNQSPDGNQNAFKNGKQVFDAYTTYNMFVNSRVRSGETATDYQLRESMPIWKRWGEKVPLFPNVMPQYYDFRGHKPLLGNSADFMRQLRAVACLPRTNFNGAPHIMFITSFNEWWEGTQIEPENGSSNNWSNYGFQFMETLAAFKKEVDSRGTYWC